jgi:hypothetical protein
LVAIENDELLLRLGMPATAEIAVATANEALLVPDALRYTPGGPSKGVAMDGGVCVLADDKPRYFVVRSADANSAE